MGSYNIGIDTGGTYTDAVILDTENREVIASAKALTTRGDLSIGVIEALGEVMRSSADTVAAEMISLVSLSTTLATNALVEGQGSRVGVILMGFDDVMLERSNLESAIPTAVVERVSRNLPSKHCEPLLESFGLSSGTQRVYGWKELGSGSGFIVCPRLQSSTNIRERGLHLYLLESFTKSRWRGP